MTPKEVLAQVQTGTRIKFRLAAPFDKVTTRTVTSVSPSGAGAYVVNGGYVGVFVPADCIIEVVGKTPKYTEPTNESRSARVDRVLFQYRRTTGSKQAEPTDLRDLLTDMMHWCQREGVDFDHELSMATDHYSEEKEGN